MLFKEQKNINIQEQSIPNIQDRRYLPRWDVNSRVTYHREDENIIHECRSKDLNCTGACIAISETLEPNQKLIMTFFLGDQSQPIHVMGRMIWQRSQAEQNLVGVHFDVIGEKMRDLIYQYAFQFRHDELV